jgi:hypothetical protein
MGFEVKVISDSISQEHNHRITTLQLKYPRFIHAEFMTHREFSRNASSSRAIPVTKMIEQVRTEPAAPIHWGKNQPGMQAHEELGPTDRREAQENWLTAAECAASVAEAMNARGVHKQVVNRILEPYQWISVVVTSTSFSNFDGLRRHPDAQPEIKHLADLMAAARTSSNPTQLVPGEWHLPYILEADWETAQRFCQVGRVTRDMPSYHEVVNVLKKVSAARCARVSYLTHEGKATDLLEDLKLFDRLVGAQPLHASPTEHQATPDEMVFSTLYERDVWRAAPLHGNFTGWVQHRKLLPGEYIG